MRKTDSKGFSQARYVTDVVNATKHPRLIPSSILAGDRTEFTMTEVSKHCTEDSAWTVYEGFVYDMTPYLNYHPGGKKILMEKAAGKDCTADFKRYHRYVSMETLLGKFKLGKLIEG